VTVLLIRSTAFGLAARSNPVNLPFFPRCPEAGRCSPRSRRTPARPMAGDGWRPGPVGTALVRGG
jgi:hypothetical protein